MSTRREFLEIGAFLSGAAVGWEALLGPIRQALAIDPDPGSSVFDAEHVVILMQENRSFDHCFGTLQGVRGFDDPQAIALPDGNPVWVQTNAAGESFAPFRLNINDTNSTWLGCLPHSWQSQVDARNEGRHDRWLDAKRSEQKAIAHIPLTLGYYNRADIPFYYELADAFTICDQHFCSCLSSTTPNRLHLWTGTIRERPTANAQANICNENADYDCWVNWTTFPERLEDHGISWKVYQNELGMPSGLDEEQYAWLANFGDNPLEYFNQFRVKLAPVYRDFLDNQAALLPGAIQQLKASLAAGNLSLPQYGAVAKQLATAIKSLEYVEAERRRWPAGGLDKLPARQRSLHDKAFVTNSADPAYRDLVEFNAAENDPRGTIVVPKGDVLYQFRRDVESGQLPTVSWLVAPTRFSDHPDSPWYGGWYISEALNILTHNRDVWKKTVFILTYDENDGYFDHVPPFVAPDPRRPETGLASKNIDTSLEYVRREHDQKRLLGGPARESPIGLGYRVPLIIASPWSRGGVVCSQVFDHTSVLQFLERLLTRKTGKPIRETNISAWRRTVCGDLTSVFQAAPNARGESPALASRNAFVDQIHHSKYKPLPTGYQRLTADQISLIREAPRQSPRDAAQEQGMRRSCPLPYELYVNGALSNDRARFVVQFEARTDCFGERAAGSPFTVYARTGAGKMQIRSFAVAAGDRLEDSWNLRDFAEGRYRLEVNGPNGFFREFIGGSDDPAVGITLGYHNTALNSRSLSGDVEVRLSNRSARGSMTVQVRDRSYKSPDVEREVAGGTTALVVVDTKASFQWYDLAVTIPTSPGFCRRFAGRVETGRWTFADPAIGRDRA